MLKRLAATKLRLALLALVGWRVFLGARGKVSGKTRAKKQLTRETNEVMAEIITEDFLKENFEGSPGGAGDTARTETAAASPLMASLSARSKKSKLHTLVNALRDQVEEDGGFPICAIVNGDLERSLLRFLIAAEFDVSTARENIRQMKAWREENDIDNLLRWILPEDKLKILRRCMPSSYHGNDKEGHPIHLERTGRFQWEILRHCSAEELVKIHILAQEYQSRVLFPRASAAKGYTVDKMANILDLQGLNLGVLSNLHALNIFKQVQRIDQKYYPEMLSVTYIVNAGWAFRAVWNVLKVVFPARDHGKMKLVPRGEKGLRMLKEVIPEEHIPKFLGGKSKYEMSDYQQKMMDDLKEIRTLFSHNVGRTDTYIQRSIRVWSVDPERKLQLEYTESETVMEQKAIMDS